MWRYIWLFVSYLIITLVPLFLRIGQNLEYEYSLAVSILALLVLPVVGLIFPKRYIPVFGPQFRPPISFEIIWIFFFSPFVMLLPGMISYAAGYCECSKMGFYFWMLVQALPCWYLGHVFYYMILKIRHEGLNRKQALAVQVCIWSLVSLTIVGILWFLPQKRMVSVFIGFLHGPIYDEWLPVDNGIFFARLAHLFLALTLMGLVWFRRKRNFYLVVSSLSVLTVILFLVSSSYESVGNGTSVLNKNFDGQYKHGKLTFHYVKDGDEQDASEFVKRLFKDSVFHYEDLSSILGVDKPEVDVYLYPDSEAKKLWFGGGATDVTDVVTPSIHITESGWPHPTLRHEMVHALSSYFAFYGLGFHPNMALTEGLAVALAPGEDDMTLDEASAALLKQDRLPELNNLFSFMFWKESGRRAYTVSGSIINFISREKGFRAVRDLYSGKSWEDSLGESKSETMNRWKKYIESIAVNMPDNLEAERLYRYAGIVQDLCPHSKADLAQARSQNLFTRLRQPVGWDPNKDYLLWRAQLEPDNFNIRFRLWKSQIRTEASQRIVRKGRIVTWAKTLEASRVFPPKKMEDVESAILQSDLERLIYGDAEGVKLLKETMNYVSPATIGADMVRQIQVRLMLDKELGAQDTISWRKYLAGWSAIPKVRGDVEPWIITYLRIRNGRGIDKEFLERIKASSPPRDASDLFKLEWYKFLGHRFYQVQLYDLAASSYNEALRYSSAGDKETIELWVRKTKYFSEKKRNI